LPAEATVSADLSRYGEVIETQLPKVKIRVDRRLVREVLPAILATQSIEDVSVEDPPLEDVIAGLFSRAGEQIAEEEAIAGRKFE
jgi:ABC-2 type transport system ATP-binding protein